MRAFPIAVIALAAIATAGAAQTPIPRTFVRVVAHDSSGAPVPGADIALTEGLKNVVAHGTTDDNGQSFFSIGLKQSIDFQVTLRKIGYTRGDRFFTANPHDTAVVPLVVGHTNQLEAVKITAERKDPRWTSYHITADDIEASNEPIENGWDVLKRLRPAMLNGKGSCGGGVREVWINDTRIRLPLPLRGEEAIDSRSGLPLDARYSEAAASVLSSIAPEHIEKIDYHDCFDTSVTAVGSKNAAFVTLKPGVMYQENVGTFVPDQPTNGHGGR